MTHSGVSPGPDVLGGTTQELTAVSVERYQASIERQWADNLG